MVVSVAKVLEQGTLDNASCDSDGELDDQSVYHAGITEEIDDERSLKFFVEFFRNRNKKTEKT
jgi:hypothetical protein